MSALRVLEPGPSTVVQDLGRPGREHEGIAPSGAFDRGAHARARGSSATRRGAAGLEVLVGGLVAGRRGRPRGRRHRRRLPRRRGRPPRGRRTSRLVVRSGAVLRLGTARRGVRAYLAVRGGLAVPPVLGSRSWDAGGRFGPPPLTAGVVLPVGDDVEGQPCYEPVVVPPVAGAGARAAAGAARRAARQPAARSGCAGPRGRCERRATGWASGWRRGRRLRGDGCAPFRGACRAFPSSPAACRCCPRQTSSCSGRTPG